MGAIIVDDYGTPPYPPGFGIYDNVTFSAFLGETDYYTTGFSNLNIHQANDTYCAGCNGSFRLSFSTTSFTVGGVGVYGVGVNILANSPSLPYYAYITYGDGTTDDIALPEGASFFGVSAPELIESIHFGLSGGGSTQGGSFVIDNLTIGTEYPPVDLGDFGTTPTRTASRTLANQAWGASTWISTTTVTAAARPSPPRLPMRRDTTPSPTCSLVPTACSSTTSPPAG